jgi:predicted  nucleic acid-binding Zn-ribbon protein
MLRKQMEKMEEQMFRKEREIKDALDRQRKTLEPKVNRAESKRGGGTDRSKKGSVRAQTQERKREPSRKKRDDLFRHDIGADIGVEVRRGWREAELEAGELATGLDVAQTEIMSLKDNVNELKSKLRSFRRRQEQSSARLGGVHSSMGHVKLVRGSNSEAAVAGLEDEVREVNREHSAQVGELQATEARLKLLHQQLGDIERRHGEYTSAKNLDDDARLVHGIDRKAQVLASRIVTLRASFQELNDAVARQLKENTAQSSQLSVAELTLSAMKAVIDESRSAL